MGTILRKAFRFSLRSLLLLITVVSIWLGLNIHAARQQQRIVTAIHDYGGYAYYDYQVNASGQYYPNTSPWESEWLQDVVGIDFFHSIVKVNLVYGQDGKTGEQVDVNRDNNEILRIVAELPHLEWLSLNGGQVTGEAIQHIAIMNKLRGIHMWDVASLTDDGVAQLADLPYLETVRIGNSDITDESLRYLASCRNIKDLYLHGGHFTDQGLSYLSGVSSLRNLWLHEGATAVSDLGLRYLKGLSNLELLAVQGDGITDAGLRSIETLKELNTLYVRSDSVTPDAFARLRKKLGSAESALFHRMRSQDGSFAWHVVR